MLEIKEIPQRELRNNVAQVLREVEAGQELRVTVRGRPIADLIPVRELPKPTAREQVLELLESSRPDPDFATDIATALDEELDAVTKWPT